MKSGAEEDLAIYQSVLDAHCEASMAQDHASIQRMHHLPYRFRTLSMDMIVEEAEVLETAVVAFNNFLQNNQATDLIRLATGVERRGDALLKGYHTTHVLRGSLQLVPPYKGSFTLRLMGESWKIVENNADLLNDRLPIEIPQVSRTHSGLATQFLDQIDMRTVEPDPLSVYQAYLDAITQTNMENDFDAWCAHCCFPHSVHTEQIDRIIHVPEGIRDFFDMLTNIFRDLGADRIERRASSAEFAGGNTICGYHNFRMYRQGEVVLGPCESRMIIECHEDQWKMKSVTNSVTNDNFPYTEPQIGSRLVSMHEINRRTRKLMESV